MILVNIGRQQIQKRASSCFLTSGFLSCLRNLYFKIGCAFSFKAVLRTVLCSRPAVKVLMLLGPLNVSRLPKMQRRLPPQRILEGNPRAVFHFVQ